MRPILTIMLLALSACAALPPAAPGGGVLVIAHRGASGERPEHTLAAYELAIEQGADFIEPDLVITRDGVLVARHENEISGTTDVADHPEFAARKTTKTVDGTDVTGWFTEDFTLAELKTLRAKERLPGLRSTAYDGRFEIPTFAEVIALAKRAGVGIYPETKHPSYFRALGLPLEEPLVAALDAAGWRTAEAPVFIQSFETGNLERLDGMTGVRLVQLFGAPDEHPFGDERTYADLASPAALAALSAHVDGVGPATDWVLRDGTTTGFVAAAHAAGLSVHPWTLRAENVFLPADYKVGSDPAAHGDIGGFACALKAAGVDGLFSDFPGRVADALATC